MACETWMKPPRRPRSQVAGTGRLRDRLSVEMKRKTAKKRVQTAEQAYEARYFARKCGLTPDEALKLIVGASTAKHLKTKQSRNH
jgi:hypothetical protein